MIGPGPAPVKKTGGVVHATFGCVTCGAEFTNYQNAQALAAQHAKKYWHDVRGEVGLAFRYNGTGNEGN